METTLLEVPRKILSIIVWRNETMHIRTKNVTFTNVFLIEHLSIPPFFMESRRIITTPSFQLTQMNFENLSESQQTAHAEA